MIEALAELRRAVLDFRVALAGAIFPEERRQSSRANVTIRRAGELVPPWNVTAGDVVVGTTYSHPGSLEIEVERPGATPIADEIFRAQARR